MGSELIFKKLDQITQVLNELERLLRVPLAEFMRDLTKVRNILVHEYDFEDGYEKFYHAAGAAIPAYREYGKTIYECIRSVKNI